VAREERRGFGPPRPLIVLTHSSNFFNLADIDDRTVLDRPPQHKLPAFLRVNGTVTGTIDPAPKDGKAGIRQWIRDGSRSSDRGQLDTFGAAVTSGLD